jgi:hypothetical protein
MRVIMQKVGVTKNFVRYESKSEAGIYTAYVPLAKFESGDVAPQTQTMEMPEVQA